VLKRQSLPSITRGSAQAASSPEAVLPLDAAHENAVLLAAVCDSLPIAFPRLLPLAEQILVQFHPLVVLVERDAASTNFERQLVELRVDLLARGTKSRCARILCPSSLISKS